MLKRSGAKGAGPGRARLLVDGSGPRWRRSGTGAGGSKREYAKAGNGKPIHASDRGGGTDPERRGSGTDTGNPVQPKLKTEEAASSQAADWRDIVEPVNKESSARMADSERHKLCTDTKKSK